jgi:hypothetical protein
LVFIEQTSCLHFKGCGRAAGNFPPGQKLLWANFILPHPALWVNNGIQVTQNFDIKTAAVILYGGSLSGCCLLGHSIFFDFVC